jgi:phenylacetic acid degradation operon negative regulatory protein
LAELARAYQRFAATFEPVKSALAGRSITPAPETAFIIRTLLIHEYRKIHLRDPLLPYSLLPADWIGARAYELCRDLYRRVFSDAEAHVAAVASTLAGKLAAPSRDTYKRFGGLLTA